MKATKLDLLKCVYDNVESIRHVQSFEEPEAYETNLWEAYQVMYDSFQKEFQQELSPLDFVLDVTDSVGWNWLFEGTGKLPTLD